MKLYRRQNSISFKSTRSDQIEPIVTSSRLDQVRSSRWCHIKSTRSSQIEPMVTSSRLDQDRSSRLCYIKSTRSNQIESSQWQFFRTVLAVPTSSYSSSRTVLIKPSRNLVCVNIGTRYVSCLFNTSSRVT